MGRLEREILDRLGAEGLSRALDDILDQNRLVRLANTCGLKYPGMRTRSQARGRILADLVQRAAQESAALRAIVRTLSKETRSTGREWESLSAAERRRRLKDDEFLRSDGQLGRHLFLLASSDDEKDLDGLTELLERGRSLASAPQAAEAKPARPSREETRLKRKAAELQRKVTHLEAQLTKSREAEKTFKRDLIQRKGELAESRMLAERLRRDLADVEEQLRRAAAPTKAADSQDLEKLGKSVRRLASEQKKLAHAIEKLRGDSAPPENAPDPIEPVQQSIRELQKELAAIRRERKKELEQQGKQVEELRTRLEKKLDAAVADRRRAARPRPRRGAERVGVFIDVQNMYYAARKLKGKLDFDALLRVAVRDRRLIRATAYVVESSEIDQSGFIAILRKRAIEVRRKTVQVRADGSMKGDWDMELALDILDAAPDLDVVVLVSGDGDFTSLVQRVKRMGPRVEVFGFPRNTAKSLLEAADQFQPLNRKFMIYSSGASARGDRAGAAADSPPPKKKATKKAPAS